VSRRFILTDVVGRTEYFANLRALQDHSRYFEVAQLYVARGKRAHQHQVLRLYTNRARLVAEYHSR